jgi:cysteine desulfuration protein SufE
MSSEPADRTDNGGAQAEAPLPPALARTLRQFRALSREDKMQALLGWSKKLEPLPAELAALDRTDFTVPECQTRVDLFPVHNPDGTLHFYADVNARQSPTVAAVLAITFAAVNDAPPDTALALPADYVRLLMQDIGLGAREAGLAAMVARIKRHAAEAKHAQGSAPVTSETTQGISERKGDVQ